MGGLVPAQHTSTPASWRTNPIVVLWSGSKILAPMLTAP